MKTTRILLLAACNQENMFEDTGNGNTAVLTTLSCGNQKTASGGTQTLTLYLNAAQNVQWEGDPSVPDKPGWSSDPDNAHVTVTVK